MSCDYLALANSGVQTLQPYQAGKPVDELERELGISNIVKLASNENPLGSSEAVKAAVINACDELSRYPDANGYYLKSRLAEKNGVNIEQITLGNGSNDLLEILARTFVSVSDEVIYSEHAFVVYSLVTQAIGANGVAVPALEFGHDLDAMLAAVTDKTKMIFIANPNNPTGTLLSSAALLRFLQAVPRQVMVVLDEAYYEYIDPAVRADSVSWVSQFPNLIVCRTFSKAYGLAGLRIGYAMSSDIVADLLNRVRQPFNCNALALAAAKAALADNAFLQKTISLNNAGMKQLCAFFEAHNISYIPSSGNFITFDTGQDAAGVYQQMLELGVIVRPIAGYGLPQHLRVSIGSEAENSRFIDVLKQIMAI